MHDDFLLQSYYGIRNTKSGVMQWEDLKLHNIDYFINAWSHDIHA